MTSVNHVGSTAVPGLAARSMIDLALENTVFPAGQVITTVLKTLDYLPANEEDATDCCRFMKGQECGFVCIGIRSAERDSDSSCGFATGCEMTRMR